MSTRREGKDKKKKNSCVVVYIERIPNTHFHLDGFALICLLTVTRTPPIFLTLFFSFFFIQVVVEFPL